MSNAIVLKPEQTWTPEQMKLITSVIASNATPDELTLFLYRCKNLGLDPLKPGQIHFVKYGTGPGTIVVGIEGFRSIAGRSGKLSGIKRGALKNEKGELVGAWAEVYRSDWTHPAREEAPLSEYDTKRGPWQKMPETMIKKVAEAAALRMAFPDSLGGTYVPEEMDQAAKNHNPIYMDQPDGGDANIDTSYRIPFGKFKQRSLEQVGVDELKRYVDYIEKDSAKKDKPIQGQVKEFIDMASGYIAAWENSPIESEA